MILNLKLKHWRGPDTVPRHSRETALHDESRSHASRYSQALGRAHAAFVLILVVSSLKWLYSKQPKLGLTQEFVVDCAHVLWVVHSTKGLEYLMLLKGFLSDSFIYFMYRILFLTTHVNSIQNEV